GRKNQVLIAGIVAVCIILAILAFLVPRLSHGPQRGGDKTLGVGKSAGSKAPGPLGRWFQKPFSTSRKATNKSAQKGREGRSKLPLFAAGGHTPRLRDGRGGACP